MILKSFSTNDAGIDPCGGLVLAGTTLYGTLAQGGDSIFGAVFKINADGSDYGVIKRFAGGSDGALPYGGLVFSGTELYGTTERGGSSDCGVVFALSLRIPNILTPPRSQTVEVGSPAILEMDVEGDAWMTYQWFFNGTNGVGGPTTIPAMLLTDLLPTQAGAYTVVVTNSFGAVTSAPAFLSVIPPIERRWVPGIGLTGQVGMPVNLEYTDTFEPGPNWLPLATVPLAGSPQFCFDLSVPLPPQRFFRAWQTGVPSVAPALDLQMVPAITLTGGIGSSVRLDCINQFGPINAWSTLATVVLTNTSQLYFDTSTIGQPSRLYRLVPVP